MRVVLGVESLLWPPLTGVGHYTRRLLAGLQADARLEVQCVADFRFVPAPVVREGDEAAGWADGISVRAKRLAARLPGLRAARDATREAILRRRARRLGAAIYHEPNQVLRAPQGPSVVTVHDLSVLHFPAFHPRDRVRYFQRRFAPSAERASLVIADSEFIRGDLVRTLGLDPAKVRVVPLGVGAEFRPLPDAAVRPVLERHGLARNGYLLAVGTREPRKNLERLIDAWTDLPLAVRGGLKLALVGPKGWRAEALERRIAALERDGAIRSLGYVPDMARPALYAGAAGFAYPSLYEGFGLPPLEAAACGTPVLTSLGSPMSEVLGGVAELVDPLDQGAIAQGLERILTDAGARARGAREGPRRAGEFGWDACVARTVAVYEELAAA